ncbi:MAG: hypothetical protein WC976_06015 [Caldisericia bacterium]
MVKNAEAAAKAKELYHRTVEVSEMQTWFLNYGEKLNRAQRRKFVSIWNISDRLAKKAFELSRMF